MNDRQPWEFTCKTCGDHKLTVTRVWHILADPKVNVDRNGGRSKRIISDILNSRKR